MPDNYFTISVAKLPVVGPSSHNIILIRDAANNVIRQINGGPMVDGALADFRRNPGAFFPGSKPLGGEINGPDDGRGYWRPGMQLPETVVGTVSPDNIQRSIDAANVCLNDVNRSGLRYGLVGQNSNSVANTILQCMGVFLPASNPLTQEPGGNRTLIPFDRIDQIRGGLDLPPVDRTSMETKFILPNGNTQVTGRDLNGQPLWEVVTDSQGHLVSEQDFNPDGSSIFASYLTNEVSIQNTDPVDIRPGIARITQYDADGRAVGVMELDSNGSQLNFDGLGMFLGGFFEGRQVSATDVISSFGSTVGSMLGGNSFASRVVGQTVGGTFAQLLGKTLTAGVGFIFNGGDFFTAVSSSLSLDRSTICQKIYWETASMVLPREYLHS